jgi:hypothetical protein
MLPQHTSPPVHAVESVQAMVAPVHVAVEAMHDEPVVVMQQLSLEEHPELEVHVKAAASTPGVVEDESPEAPSVAGVPPPLSAGFVPAPESALPAGFDEEPPHATTTMLLRAVTAATAANENGSFMWVVS